jgi:hypothetical protein
MSSNQSASTISSNQLNELVRVVVRMFVNEAKAVDKDYWKAHEIGQMLWGKNWAVNQSKASKDGRVFKFNSSDWRPNMSTKDFMSSIDKGMKVSRFLWQTPEGNWKSLDPKTKKWSDVNLTDNPSENVEEMTGTGAVAGFASPMAFSKRKVKENDASEKLHGRFVNRGEVKLEGGLDYRTAEKIANHHWDIFGSLGADERGVYNFKTRGDRFCCAVGMYQGKPAILSVTTTPGRLELLVGDEAYPSDSQNIKEAASGNTDPTREEMIEYLQHVYSGLLDRSSFDDAVEPAMYWFANFNHGGQSSNLYSVLSTSPYNPGRMENETRPDTIERDMFDALTREFGTGESGTGEEAEIDENFSAPDTIYKDREGGRDVYWINNRDSGGKIFLKPEVINRYLRKGYELVDLQDADAPVNEGEEADAVHDMHSDHEAAHYEKHYGSASKKAANTKKPAKTPRKVGKALVKGKVITLKESDKELYENYVYSLMDEQQIPEEKKKELEEMTTTGDVSGYNVPSAFARKGGSKKGVEGSAALGYTLTSIGQKEMERTGDKLLESKPKK